MHASVISVLRNVARTNKKANEISQKRENDIVTEERSLTMHFNDMDTS